jgi:uncharacterized membrane protein YhhN
MAMKDRLQKLAAPAIVFLLLLAPSVSQACSQCLATRTRETKIAFIATTVFLSVMPLLLVGAIALWLRKRVREAEERQPGDELLSEAARVVSRPAPIG